MPRPLKQLNPYASWTRLFGATVRQLRLRPPDSESLTQADLGRRIAYSGATVSAVERGTLRPEEAFVEAVLEELAAEDESERQTYERAMPLWQSYAGLKRYVDKRNSS